MTTTPRDAAGFDAPPAAEPSDTKLDPSLSEAPPWSDDDEISRFAEATERYLAGALDAEEFRRLRLWHGVYGVRQLTDVHMVRAKVPGGALTPGSLDALADVAESWSRGWGHLTTRQNVEFHFVRIADVPAVLRRLAAAGLTTREACGDTVRNICACPLAGCCPSEVLDVNAACEAVARDLLRNPIAQNLPRKFKAAFSGCAADCADAGIGDLGVIATEQDGRKGFRILVGGGLSAAPRAAQPLEPFTPPEALVVTARAVLSVWDRETPDRHKRARVRMKFLLGRLGIEEFRAKVCHERERLRSAHQQTNPEWLVPPRLARPEPSLPERWSYRSGDPAGYAVWRTANVTGQRQAGRLIAHVAVPLGDVTASQFRTLARLARELGIGWRVTLRQSLIARDVRGGDVGYLYDALAAAGLAEPGADAAASVVSCPGTETCNLALTASRGAARAITAALRSAHLADVGISINVSGCQNSCGQQQLADIGLSGQVRRVGTDEAPGYRILLGGGVTGGVRFGTYVAKVPAKRAPDAVVAIVSRYASERHHQEGFGAWFDRAGAETLRHWLAPYNSKQTRARAPGLFTDWGETEPFQVLLGRGECAS